LPLRALRIKKTPSAKTEIRECPKPKTDCHEHPEIGFYKRPELEIRERPCFGFYGRPEYETGFASCEWPEIVFVSGPKIGFYERPKTAFRESRSVSGPAAMSYIELNLRLRPVSASASGPAPGREHIDESVDLVVLLSPRRPSLQCQETGPLSRCHSLLELTYMLLEGVTGRLKKYS
jgi:hypothetical protein